MKRFWIGIGILSFLLAMSLAIHIGMNSVNRPIAADLHKAVAASIQEDWPQAASLADRAAGRWEKYHRFVASFADHTPMDEMDGLFAELKIYAREQEMPHFASTCAHLAQLVEAMAESHSVSWWNLL